MEGCLTALEKFMSSLYVSPIYKHFLKLFFSSIFFFAVFGTNVRADDLLQLPNGVYEYGASGERYWEGISKEPLAYYYSSYLPDYTHLVYILAEAVNSLSNNNLINPLFARATYCALLLSSLLDINRLAYLVGYQLLRQSINVPDSLIVIMAINLESVINLHFAALPNKMRVDARHLNIPSQSESPSGKGVSLDVVMLTGIIHPFQYLLFPGNKTVTEKPDADYMETLSNTLKEGHLAVVMTPLFSEQENLSINVLVINRTTENYCGVKFCSQEKGRFIESLLYEPELESIGTDEPLPFEYEAGKFTSALGEHWLKAVTVWLNDVYLRHDQCNEESQCIQVSSMQSVEPSSRRYDLEEDTVTCLLLPLGQTWWLSFPQSPLGIVEDGGEYCFGITDSGEAFNRSDIIDVIDAHQAKSRLIGDRQTRVLINQVTFLLAVIIPFPVSRLMNNHFREARNIDLLSEYLRQNAYQLTKQNSEMSLVVSAVSKAMLAATDQGDTAALVQILSDFNCAKLLRISDEFVQKLLAQEEGVLAVSGQTVAGQEIPDYVEGTTLYDTLRDMVKPKLKAYFNVESSESASYKSTEVSAALADRLLVSGHINEFVKLYENTPFLQQTLKLPDNFFQDLILWHEKLVTQENALLEKLNKPDLVRFKDYDGRDAALKNTIAGMTVEEFKEIVPDLGLTSKKTIEIVGLLSNREVVKALSLIVSNTKELPKEYRFLTSEFINNYREKLEIVMSFRILTSYKQAFLKSEQGVFFEHFHSSKKSYIKELPSRIIDGKTLLADLPKDKTDDVFQILEAMKFGEEGVPEATNKRMFRWKPFRWISSFMKK